MFKALLALLPDCVISDRIKDVCIVVESEAVKLTDEWRPRSESDIYLFAFVILHLKIK